MIESVWADRPVAVLARALDEILALGFSFLPADDVGTRWPTRCVGRTRPRRPRPELAVAHFSMKALKEGRSGRC